MKKLFNKLPILIGLVIAMVVGLLVVFQILPRFSNNENVEAAILAQQVVEVTNEDAEKLKQLFQTEQQISMPRASDPNSPLPTPEGVTDPSIIYSDIITESIAVIGQELYFTYKPEDGIIDGHFCQVIDGKIYFVDWNIAPIPPEQRFTVKGVFHIVDDLHPSSFRPVPWPKIYEGKGASVVYLTNLVTGDGQQYCVRASVTNWGDP